VPSATNCGIEIEKRVMVFLLALTTNGEAGRGRRSVGRRAGGPPNYLTG
jgi:hypothetical protein